MAISIFSLLRTLSAWKKGNFQISTHNLSFLRDWVLSQGVFSQSHTSTAGNIWVWPPSPSQAAFPQPQPFHSRIHQQDPRSCFVIYDVQEIDFPPQLSTFIIKVLWCRVHLQPFLHFFRINMMWINFLCLPTSHFHPTGEDSSLEKCTGRRPASSRDSQGCFNEQKSVPSLFSVTLRGWIKSYCPQGAFLVCIYIKFPSFEDFGCVLQGFDLFAWMLLP